MERSTVKWFDAKKGYGFINHPKGGDDVFVHYSQIVTEEDFKTLRTGQSVTFDLSDGPKGVHALDVKPLDGEEGEDAERDEPAHAEAHASPSNEKQQDTAAGTEAQKQDDDDDDEWEWNEEEWTDEYGNPPDPMAGPTF